MFQSCLHHGKERTEKQSVERKTVLGSWVSQGLDCHRREEMWTSSADKLGIQGAEIISPVTFSHAPPPKVARAACRTFQTHAATHEAAMHRLLTLQ